MRRLLSATDIGLPIANNTREGSIACPAWQADPEETQIPRKSSFSTNFSPKWGGNEAFTMPATLFSADKGVLILQPSPKVDCNWSINQAVNSVNWAWVCVSD
jgi:hypothetical protein